MSEENVNNGDVEGAESGKQGASAETENADKPIMIPKSRYDEKNAELKAAQDRLAKFEEAQKTAEEEAAKQQGEYESLWKKAQQEAEEAKNELARVAHNNLRRQVATEAGYPQLWERISGEDEKSLKGDMDALIAALPKASAPSLDGATGTKSRAKDQKKVKTPDEKARLGAILGVNPQYIPD